MFLQQTWCTLDNSTKIATVLQLQSARQKLALSAKKARRKKVHKKKKNMKFKSQELADLFSSLPDDMKKFIQSK